MAARDREQLKELIAGIREEAEGDRGEYYEIYGSPIRSVLLPLAELLEVNLDSNPELVELLLINFTQDLRYAGPRMVELWSLADSRKAALEAAVSPELPEYFAPKPMPSGIYDPLGVAEAANPEKLWKFYWDCGRQGSVEGTFVATQAEIDAAIGAQVYFGEILGKHSEVYGSLDAADLTLLSEDQSFIESWKNLSADTGYNPLEYLEENEEDEDY